MDFMDKVAYYMDVIEQKEMEKQAGWFSNEELNSDPYFQNAIRNHRGAIAAGALGAALGGVSTHGSELKALKRNKKFLKSVPNSLKSLMLKKKYNKGKVLAGLALSGLAGAGIGDLLDKAYHSYVPKMDLDF